MKTGRGFTHKWRLLFVLLALVLLVLLTPGAAQESLPAPSSTISEKTDQSFRPPMMEDGKPVIYFFFNHNCGECLKTLPYVEDFSADHPDVIVKFIDVMSSDENLALFKDFKDYYGTGSIAVPSVFVGNITLTGYDQITQDLPAAVNTTLANPPELPPETGIETGVQEEITLPLIIVSALVDGINPCAFSVLIFLLLTIMAIGSRRKVLVVGITFIIAVFTFYFLSGLGIFTIIQTAGISRLISFIAALIALGAGIISIATVIIGQKGPAILSIPESRKGIIDQYIRKASVPAAFAVGLLVGMFELPCTGGIYLAILSLLSNRMTAMEGIPYLLVYNLFFVLPLIVILGIFAWGLPVEKLDKWRTESRRGVRVIMGVVMISLGIILLLEIF
jgi:cytochrome c biogenesis protein CcdA/thiol-disulfide isomerase/thioredoxin